MGLNYKMEAIVFESEGSGLVIIKVGPRSKTLEERLC